MSDDNVTLPYEFESADSIPEGFRNAYEVTEGGGARLRMTLDGRQVQNLAGLMKAHEETNGKLSKRADEMRALEERLGRYKDPESGEYLDPDEVRSSLSRLRSGQVKDESEVQAAIQKARQDAAKEALAQRDEERNLRLQVEEQIAEEKLDSAAVLAGAKTTCPPDVVVTLVRQHAKMVRDDGGKLGAVVLNDDGNPRLSLRDGSAGESMGIEELVQDVLPQLYPNFFPSKAEGGSPRGRSGQAATSDRFRGMRGRSKLTAAVSNGKANQGR